MLPCSGISSSMKTGRGELGTFSKLINAMPADGFLKRLILCFQFLFPCSLLSLMRRAFCAHGGFYRRQFGVGGERHVLSLRQILLWILSSPLSCFDCHLEHLFPRGQEESISCHVWGSPTQTGAAWPPVAAAALERHRQ